MKRVGKYWWIFFFLFAIILKAQDHSSAIKLGYYAPQVTDGGFIIGYEDMRSIDQYLRIGWSVDWFHKRYVDEKYANELNENFPGTINGELNELRATTNLHDIPALFNMTYQYPLEEKIWIYGGGSIGAEMLFIFYRDFQNPEEDEFKAAFDFSWRMTIGVALQIGPRSDLFGEISYHSSRPSWTYSVQDTQTGRKKTFERVYDMSGFIFRTGVRFYY